MYHLTVTRLACDGHVIKQHVAASAALLVRGLCRCGLVHVVHVASASGAAGTLGTWLFNTASKSHW